MKVLCLFDYASADRSWERWQNKEDRESPEHHLWGITHLHKYDIDVDVLPYEKFRLIKRIGEKLKLGDLDQQLRVIFVSHRYDLIYSTCQTSTLILGLLRILGILKTPLVVKLERPFKNNTLNKILLKIFAKGHDKILCLSDITENQLRDDFKVNQNKLALLDWGADLTSYDDYQFPDNDMETQRILVSAGNESRDYNTLVHAVSKVGCPLKIYCSSKSAPTVTPIPPNIKIQYGNAKSLALAWKALSWKELLSEYAKAYAIAIPLYIPGHRIETTPLYGLTSLLDAISMGKPVIMTKHKQANIDIEKEKIGLWVEPGDVMGWQQAVSYLLRNPEEAQQMGKNGRLLAEKKYNLENFSSQLATALKTDSITI
ncbi:MAG: glycosyltransferase family 4 protein [Sphaerospermopsis sp. SIO1G1]|nr:glycosyltransferase family 4 protein [Sphaerospermopsis sp. SIO1G1]